MASTNTNSNETRLEAPKFQPHLTVGACENNAIIADADGKLWHVDFKQGTVEEVVRTKNKG